MKCALAIVLLIAVMEFRLPAQASPIVITVVNQPIDATAIYRNGRLLLPLRATFEALNSTVSYNRTQRIVSARNILHVLQLRLGSRIGVLDGRTVMFDTPLELHDGRLYVPLRFAAEAMGAIVRYYPHRRIIAVNGSDDSVQSQPAAAQAPQELIPPPNSSVLTAYPVVSASLGNMVARNNSVIFTLDGMNVTAHSAFDGRTITYVTNAALAAGRHTVAFSGETTSGQKFSTQWSFVAEPPPEGQDAYAYTPYQFFAGPFKRRASATLMNLTVIGPPTGSGFVQVCSPSFIYPLWNSGGLRYDARLALPAYVAGPACPINAVFIDGHGHRTTLVPVSSSGSIYLTGNPLFPMGQFSGGPIFIPVFSNYPARQRFGSAKVPRE